MIYPDVYLFCGMNYFCSTQKLGKDDDNDTRCSGRHRLQFYTKTRYLTSFQRYPIHISWWGIGPKKMRPKWVNWCSFEEEQWSRKDPRPQPVSSVTTPCPRSLGHIYQRWGRLICLAIKHQKTNTTIWNCVIILSTDISCFRRQSRV